jgi:hypothetical protein
LNVWAKAVWAWCSAPGFDRTAFQFERETAGSDSLAARSLRQGISTAKVASQVSQEMLAEMIGTTRSRVNFVMNKFKKLGFIEYNGEIRINRPLLSVVLHRAALLFCINSRASFRLFVTQ